MRALDPRFDGYRLHNAAVERIATDYRWAEGSVWFGDHHCLLWSDIPSNRMLCWDEATGAVTVFRSPSNHANGHTHDRQGRLVSCERLTRRVTRTEHDGSIAVLIDQFDGRPLNAPNDVVVASDGSVWFTDPATGSCPTTRVVRRPSSAHRGLPPRPRRRPGRPGDQRPGATQRPLLPPRRVPPPCRRPGTTRANAVMTS